MGDHNDIILKIINCVKEHPALYDTAHEDYNRYYKKIQIWNSIAAEVNYSDGKSAQTKWRNIRDSYVKHLKSLQTTEPAYRKYRNWQWVEQMSFLKKFLGGNKHKNSNKSAEMETSLIEVVESVYNDPSFNDSENPESTTVKRKSETEIWSYNESLQQDCDTFYPKDYIVENTSIEPNVPNMDATDLLFLSYAKTLKNFSLKRQILVKMKICEIMGQAELDELNEKSGESNYVDSSDNSRSAKVLRLRDDIEEIIEVKDDSNVLEITSKNS